MGECFIVSEGMDASEDTIYILGLSLRVLEETRISQTANLKGINKWTKCLNGINKPINETTRELARI